jgi:hypothetical protein
MIAVAVGALAGLGCAAGAGAAERIDGFAGSGVLGWSGDGGPARTATLASPSGGVLLADGGALIADSGNHRIRRVGPDGSITTVAGSGPCCGDAGGQAGDGLAATDPAVRLNGPRAVAVHPDGRILIADTDNHVVRAITPAGVIERIAGTGTGGYGTEGGPASSTTLNRPSGLAVAADGAILVADTGNHRVLRIAPGTNTTSRVAGWTPTAGPGYNGDGIPATSAQLNAPAGLAIAPGGGFLIADAGNHRIRAVDGNGGISTVAGNGTTGPLLGDGGAATLAALAQPQGVVRDADGTIVIADTAHARFRAVAPDGVIRTIAGTGGTGGLGDGGDPLLAELSSPRGVSAGPRGPLLYDTGNHRVRGLSPAPPPSDPPLPPPAAPSDPPAAPPQPTLRRAAVATPVRGRIRVRLPGTRRFVPATGALRLPMGSEVDARDGAVALRFRTTRGAAEATATVSEGRFVLRQSAVRDGGHYPGVVVLAGPLRNCPKPARRSGSKAASRESRAASRAAKRRTKRRSGRRVTVDARGKIKTRGKYGAATVRGTRWTMIDRCVTAPRPGTLTIVREGRVAVDAFVLRKRTLVRAGRSYLAPARRR